MIRKFTRMVNKMEVTVHLDTSTLDPGPDLDEEAGKVASQIGLAGEMLAVQTEKLEVADARYRHWRAGQSSLVLRSDSKLAEWKVKVQVDKDPAFMTHKSEIAKLTGDIEFLRAFLSGLRTKASMIRGRIELARGERDGSSLGLDIRPDDKPKTTRKTRADSVRSAMTRGNAKE